jgi:ribosomal protein L37E
MPYKRSRWSINSPDGASYIKARVENDINAQFSYNFIVTNDDALKAKPPILVCDRCKIVYSLEDKYCSSCSYPLTTQAYEEIKTHEDKKLQEMAQRHEEDMKTMCEEMESKFQRILAKIDIRKIR